MRGFCDPERHLRAGLPLKIRKSRETFPIRTHPRNRPCFREKKRKMLSPKRNFGT